MDSRESRSTERDLRGDDRARRCVASLDTTESRTAPCAPPCDQAAHRGRGPRPNETSALGARRRLASSERSDRRTVWRAANAALGVALPAERVGLAPHETAPAKLNAGGGCFQRSWSVSPSPAVGRSQCSYVRCVAVLQVRRAAILPEPREPQESSGGGWSPTDARHGSEPRAHGRSAGRLRDSVDR